MSPRRRSHLLLHESHADPTQRLLVAFEQSTYIQPHRHPEQWEMIIPMRGVLALLLFSDNGHVADRIELTAGSIPISQITVGAWHTVVALTPSALMLEIKPGPYRVAEFLELFPPENSPDARRAAEWLTSAKAGDYWQL
ncbi:WbuC family cupin fold metalloprotein [Nitrobacter sp. Nb-311A]|uniref:WbuC family cupin fold metalloprotein n=1 Tax=Nitrobacter sp. Nb-311A TaxID=314253 RepID=UPI001FD8BAEC|nr:WbuC family cupin fold metalloprotein [Nitrobacter sp. Nb-311A]